MLAQTPGLNWLAVYRHLDYEEFSIQSQDGLVVLVHCWRSVQQVTTSKVVAWVASSFD